MLYDKGDRMSRVEWLRETGVKDRQEKRARALGLPWPPWIQLGSRIFYSRERTAQWFLEQDRKSQNEGAVTDD